MFDKLIDFVLQFLDRFACLTIIEAYEQGVVLRFGRFKKVFEPGVHFVWPVIERVISENVVPKVYDLNAQSLTTADGVSVVVSGIVTARVHDVRRSVLEVDGVLDAIKNSSVAEIARAVKKATWSELSSVDFDESLTAACRKKGFKWGMEIMEVQLSDMSKSRTVRLFHDYGTQKN